MVPRRDTPVNSHMASLGPLILLLLLSEPRTVCLQPSLRNACSVSCGAVLLKDEACAQETLAVCDQFGQQTINIVVGVNFGLLFHEQQHALDDQYIPGDTVEFRANFRRSARRRPGRTLVRCHTCIYDARQRRRCDIGLMAFPRWPNAAVLLADGQV